MEGSESSEGFLLDDPESSSSDDQSTALQTRNEELRALLMENQQAFQSLIQASPLGIAIVGGTGKIELSNRMLEQQFGYTHDEIIGLHISALLPERFREAHAQQFDEFLTNARVRLMGISLDLFGVRKDGVEFPVEVGLGFLKMEDETKAIAYIADITIRKRTEHQTKVLLIEREQTRLIQSFVQDLAHDFRTPLSTIMAASYLLQRQHSPDKQLLYAQQIESQAKQINNLVDNLLRSVQLENANITSILQENADINEIVRDIAEEQELTAMLKNIHLNLSLEEELPYIVVDKDEIKRALRIFVENAVKYTLSEGMVTIRTYLDHKYIGVQITDTGIGIPEDSVNHIFERFFRSETSRQLYPNGIGLGLSIAKKIIDLHQGIIGVESTVGGGSTFSIRLPVPL